MPEKQLLIRLSARGQNRRLLHSLNDPFSEGILLTVKVPPFSQANYPPAQNIGFSDLKTSSGCKRTIYIENPRPPFVIAVGRLQNTWRGTISKRISAPETIGFSDQPENIQRVLRAIQAEYDSEPRPGMMAAFLEHFGFLPGRYVASLNKMLRPSEVTSPSQPGHAVSMKQRAIRNIGDFCIGDRGTPSGLPIPSFAISLPEFTCLVSRLASLLVFREEDGKATYEIIPIGRGSTFVHITQEEQFLSLRKIAFLKIQSDIEITLSPRAVMLLDSLGLPTTPTTLKGIAKLPELVPNWRERYDYELLSELLEIARVHGLELKNSKPLLRTADAMAESENPSTENTEVHAVSRRQSNGLPGRKQPLGERSREPEPSRGLMVLKPPPKPRRQDF